MQGGRICWQRYRISTSYGTSVLVTGLRCKSEREVSMSEVANETQHEFWRPPAAQQAAALAGMVEACDRCGTEFMVGARFCHVCGTSRSAHASVAREQSWTRHLEFQNIMQGLRNMGNGLSLSPASLVA